jgi:hypothetical protein
MQFDNEGNLVIRIEERPYRIDLEDIERIFIPSKQVKVIETNLRAQKPFYLLSPLYPITRRQAAFILCAIL